ncbi:MAG: HlyD family efflux transporter periplasmic adaptor subunit [Betaproteobacteria bacterium]|nr:HlyD family efflux transporter periplasmic adaptor subunit [Betaproteobacteria bacterium]
MSARGFIQTARAHARHNAPLVAAALALLLAACGKPAPLAYSGYVEGDTVRLAAPLSGTLTAVYVQRGTSAAANAPAFVLEHDAERAAVDEARSRVDQAKAQQANLVKGRRPDEIATITAQLAQAQAALALSDTTLARQQQLVAQGFTSAASLDGFRAQQLRDANQVREVQAQLRVARNGARPDEIAAAAQQVNAAQAQLAQAQWRLQQKAQRVPVAAEVLDVLYRPGEWVPAGSPVVSLLPPGNVKARFFVPEPVLGTLALGQPARVSCDGCGAPIAARISYIASEAEFTSPLIYSRENRASLVFMVEARPAPGDALRLHPGQPVQVQLGDGAATRSGP